MFNVWQSLHYLLKIILLCATIKTFKMDKFDLCVIGAGPAGYSCAMRALDFGKKVLLVEKAKPGGAGVFNGALSSKTLWELSESYKVTKSLNKGFAVYNSDLNYQAVIGEMRNAMLEKHAQLREQIDYFCRKGNLTYLQGTGKMITKNIVQIDTNDGNILEYFAENIGLAVGSRPRKLPTLPIDERTVVTSDGIGEFEDFPKSLVILGAGVIGTEFATIFSNFGRTKVYMIDRADRILPFEDEDIANVVAHNLEENGVTIHHESNFEEMKIVDGKVEYTISKKDGSKQTYVVEKALISIGRVPNVENIGLKEIGLALDSRGYAEDEDTVTSIPNIYAIGDFTADIALVNIAEMEGRYAAERMFADKPDFEMTYNNISTIMFLNPEVAGVGMNETQARKEGIGYRVAGIKYKFLNRAIAMRNTEGFFKIIVTNDDDMKILGLRAMGAHASSTIGYVALLIKQGLGIRELADLIHPHPSISEGIQACARMLLGKSIMKPEVFGGISCYSVSAQGKITDHNPSDRYNKSKTVLN